MKDLSSYLGSQVHVVMDRPLGSRHPRFDFVYPVNYGYIPDTVSGDGKEVDAYVLGIDEPLQVFDGVCMAVIHRKDDIEDKLIVVPEGIVMTDKEIAEQVAFQERWFDVTIIR